MSRTDTAELMAGPVPRYTVRTEEREASVCGSGSRVMREVLSLGLMFVVTLILSLASCIS